MSRWAGRHVVLGVSGGIACYKSCFLARRLAEAGARVDAVLTRAAAEFAAGRNAQATRVIGEGTAIGVQHDHPGLRPQGAQRIRVIAEVVGAVQRAIDEGEGRKGGQSHFFHAYIACRHRWRKK